MAIETKAVELHALAADASRPNAHGARGDLGKATEPSRLAADGGGVDAASPCVCREHENGARRSAAVRGCVARRRSAADAQGKLSRLYGDGRGVRKASARHRAVRPCRRCRWPCRAQLQQRRADGMAVAADLAAGLLCIIHRGSLDEWIDLVRMCIAALYNISKIWRFHPSAHAHRENVICNFWR